MGLTPTKPAKRLTIRKIAQRASFIDKRIHVNVITTDFAKLPGPVVVRPTGRVV